MIGTLIQILFALIILGVIWWAIQQLLPLIPLGEPFRTIIHVILVVILVLIVLWVIWTLLVATGITSGRPFRIGGIPGGTAAALSTAATGYLPQLLG